MFDESSSQIDAEQKRVEELDKTPDDSKVIFGSKDYADTYIRKVDDFQSFVSSADVPDELKKQQFEDVAKFLKGVDAGTSASIESLTLALTTKLSDFRGEVEALEGELGKRHEVKRGDTVSGIVESKLGIKWKDDPARFFAGVKFLQDKRQDPGCVLTIQDGKVKWEAGPSDPNQLDVGEYFVTEGLSAVKTGTPADVDWYLNFSSSAPYERALKRSLQERGQTQDGAMAGEVVATGGVRASTDALGEAVDAAAEDADVVAAAEAAAAAAALDGALASGSEQGEVDPTIRTQAEAVLDDQQQVALRMQQEQFVQEFINDLKQERDGLQAKVAEMREEQTGWSGYGHAIEPSNLLSSIGGSVRRAFGGEAMASGDAIRYEMTQAYAQTQEASLGGLYVLLRTMKGSERAGNEVAPMSLEEAWVKLETGGDADFTAFQGSPEGRYFKSMFVEGRMNDEAARNDFMAKMYYDKGMEMMGRVGKREAQTYFMSVVSSFPGSEWAAKAKPNLLTGWEKAGHIGTEVGDCLLRLDMLLLMALSAGGGALLKGGAIATKIAELTAQYPRAAKILPGLRLLQAGEGAGALTRLGYGTANFAFEIGKFMAIVEGTRHVAGDEAAYAAMGLCFFMPGVIHGFEKVAGKSVEAALAEEGAGTMARLGEIALAEAGGNPLVLREAIVVGMEREAKAAGEMASREVLVERADDMLGEFGIQARGAARESTATAERAAAEGVSGLSVQVEAGRRQLVELLKAGDRIVLEDFDGQATEFVISSVRGDGGLILTRAGTKGKHTWELVEEGGEIGFRKGRGGEYKTDLFRFKGAKRNGEEISSLSFAAEHAASREATAAVGAESVARSELAGLSEAQVREIEAGIEALFDGSMNAARRSAAWERLMSVLGTNVTKVSEAIWRGLSSAGRSVGDQFIQKWRMLSLAEGNLSRFMHISSELAQLFKKLPSALRVSWRPDLSRLKTVVSGMRSRLGQGLRSGADDATRVSEGEARVAAERSAVEEGEVIVRRVRPAFLRKVKEMGTLTPDYLESLAALDFKTARRLVQAHEESILYLQDIVNGKIKGIPNFTPAKFGIPEGHPLVRMFDGATNNVERQAVLREMIKYLETTVDHLNLKAVKFAQFGRPSASRMAEIGSWDEEVVVSKLNDYRTNLQFFRDLKARGDSQEIFLGAHDRVPGDHNETLRQLYRGATTPAERAEALDVVIANIEGQVRAMEARFAAPGGKEWASMFESLRTLSPERFQLIEGLSASDLRQKISSHYSVIEKFRAYIENPTGELSYRIMPRELRNAFVSARNHAERKAVLEEAIIPNMEAQIRAMEARLATLEGAAGKAVEQALAEQLGEVSAERLSFIEGLNILHLKTNISDTKRTIEVLGIIAKEPNSSPFKTLADDLESTIFHIEKIIPRNHNPELYSALESVTDHAGLKRIIEEAIIPNMERQVSAMEGRLTQLGPEAWRSVFESIRTPSEERLRDISSMNKGEVLERLYVYRSNLSALDRVVSNFRNGVDDIFLYTGLPSDHAGQFRAAYHHLKTPAERLTFFEEAVLPNMRSQIEAMEARLATLEGGQGSSGARVAA